MGYIDPRSMTQGTTRPGFIPKIVKSFFFLKLYLGLIVSEKILVFCEPHEHREDFLKFFSKLYHGLIVSEKIIKVCSHLWDLYVANGNQRSNPIQPKTLCSLSTILCSLSEI